MLTINRNGVGNSDLFKAVTQNIIFTIASPKSKNFALYPPLAQPSNNRFSAVSAFENVELTYDLSDGLVNFLICPIVTLFDIDRIS